MTAGRARLQLVVTAVLFSTGGAAIKSAAFDAWQVAGLRSAVAAAVLLAVAPEARKLSPRLLPIAATYAATLILFVTANKLTTAANAIFLQSAAPIYLVALGPLVLREPVTRRDLVLLALMGQGLVLVMTGQEPPARTAPDPLLGNTLAVLSGVMWAGTITALRWLGRQPGGGAGPGIAAVSAGNLVAALVCLPVGWPVGAATPADWLAIGYLGTVQIAIAYLLMTRGLRHVPALEASMLLLIEPVLSPVWAWVVHGERPGAGALAGGALILAATALHALLQRRAAPGAA